MLGNSDNITSTASTTSPVQETLEVLLSKKNLVCDQFLAGSMNPQMYIPISTLLAHGRLEHIGATEEDVVAAATRSTRLGIDESRTMVRPLLKSKRNIIIMRDVPEGTTESEMRELFSEAPHADRLKDMKPEVNNTWFVKFNLDEGTQDVVLWLRSQKLKGKPVNAAIKSEHFLRSFFPLQLPNQGMPQVPYPPMNGNYDGIGWADVPQQNQGMGGMGMPGDGFSGPGAGGLIMPMMQAGPPLPSGPQPPGFWQPWGARDQPAALMVPH